MDGSTVVSTVVKIVGEKLGSAAFKELGLIWGVKDDLEELEGTISTVRGVVANAEDRCLIKDDPLYNWLRELKEVVYDANDLLDKIYLETEKWKVKPYGQTSKFIGNFISNANPIKRLKLAHKIQSLNKKLSIIAARKANFHLPSMVVGSREEAYFKNQETFLKIRKTHSKVDEDNICGRDTELENIMSQLKHIDENENISVISIVGLGGVGKTTLAKLVYNNEDELKKYFKHKMWVYVSQDFNVERIVTAMIESMSQKRCELEYLETIVENITGQLKDKRFLLILDDIWIENQLLWDDLEIVLKCGAPGSKIIATTRSMGVSNVMKSTYTCNLNVLSEEESWDLFKKRAFGSEEKLDPDIEEIAKEIVEKCGGVPLALKTLGSTMHNKCTVEKWKAIRNSEIWKKINDEVMASLALSYMNLSSELKECFSFCSIFPKGHFIYKEELIGQWMANGLVSFTRSTGGMEDDLGNEYFEQLVQVSFLQNVDDGYHSTTMTCNMHDLVHDLAQSISDQRILLINDVEKAINKDNGKVNPTKIKKMRALYISSGDSSVISMVSRAQNLRSLFLERIALVGTLPMSFKKLIHLRFICISYCEFTVIPNDIGALWSLEALHLRGCYKIKCLPKSIGKLIYLRTLEINLRMLKNLPESIGNLINLERLDLKWCENLKYLPESIGKIDKLCYLNLIGCKSFEKVPESIGNLLNLKRLHLSWCNNLKCLPKSIGNLVNLRVLNLDLHTINTIPKSIYNLTKLTSVNLDRFQRFFCMPAGISKINSPDIEGLSFSCGFKRNELGSISELEHLNIRGHLEIHELQNINDPGEATKANLKKKNLNGLTLSWNRDALLHGLTPSFKSSLPLLEALQPPSSIKSLAFEGYLGEQYPNWMMLSDEMRMTPFPNLTSLTLSNLKRCSNLQSLVGLPHLEYIKLEWMQNLTTISGHFPSLLELHLCHLEELTTMKLDTENIYKPSFPRLSKMEISWCPKIRIQPHIPPSVVELKLDWSNEELLGVESFNGEASSEICSQPLGIRELTIRRMETELVLLKHLSSLTRLEFERCMRNCLPESMRHLSSLRILEIVSCRGLHALPEWLGELKSLEDLKIWRTPLITCLPRSMKHMSSLRKLFFWGCDGLRELPDWFGELKSLKDLRIFKTPLSCLPKSMKQLTALESLRILDCPELKRRCEREKGEDWHLISHIPFVDIFGDLDSRVLTAIARIRSD